MGSGTTAAQGGGRPSERCPWWGLDVRTARGRGRRWLTSERLLQCRRRGSNPFEPIQNLNDSNEFKSFQTLTDPKSTLS
jgi:hypothetical protein